MDDILTYGETREEHNARPKKTLERRILESGLKLNRDKCEIERTQIKYLGHIISEMGISPNPERVKPIKELLAPTNEKKLRRVIGMINYLGRFLPDLSTTMKPISDLLKSDVAWLWGPSQQEAFNKIKDMLTKSPVLTFYDIKKPIVVNADASSYDLGEELFQQEGAELKPFANNSLH